MKTNNKLSAYILRGSTAALLFLSVIVALCSAINLPEQSRKALPAQDNAAFEANAHQNGNLSFAERVAYQRAIEEVHWRHRIWPKERPNPKPLLAVVMSQATIEKKVQDYLRKSELLEREWEKPIRPEQLQAEMDRMASHTKQPEVLRELFAALGNDPFVIAECLARPVLAERFANSDPLVATPNAFGVVHPARMPPQKPLLAGWLAKAETQVPVLMAAANANYALPAIPGRPSGCIDDSWTATTTTNAPEARFGHTAVWTGSEMIIWGGADLNNVFNTGARYNPSTDSWTATSTTNAPTAREFHTAVWTGSEMIIWGGADFTNVFNTGARYNPSTDSWTATSTTNAPFARDGHTAVWTGSEMIVWGGCVDTLCFNIFSDGGRYNLSTDSWTATSAVQPIEARFGHTAVWTGSEMIIWGGANNLILWNDGLRYNPSTDSWTATSTTNEPSGRDDHTAVWTGSEMIVWGGCSDSSCNNFYNDGGRYNPGTDSWTATSTTNAPDARSSHTAVWTGSEMIIWGGADATNPFNDGGRYNPGTDSWTATTTTNAPTARIDHTAVWTGSEMIVWGGWDESTFFDIGGKYCAAVTSPPPTPTPRSTPTPRARPTPAPRP